MIKRISISLAIALTTNIILYGGYTIYASNNVDSSFRADGLHYETIFDLYHREMNNFFNQKVTALKELLADDQFMKDPEKRKNFIVPEDIAKEIDDLDMVVYKCQKNGENVSSYCVSMEALSTYLEFVNHLESQKSSLQDGSSSTIQGRVAELASKTEAIEKEIDKARAVMEGTISAYTEFSLAYPMHRKYQEIINNLLKYKLSLKDIREEVTLFPIKFIDATSSQCQ